MIQREKNQETLIVLRHFQYDHRLFQQGERLQYYSRRMLAIKNPHHYCSMIVDGMTQATTAIPNKADFAYNDKRLEQKLIGILVHGAGE